jgi:hypothetical protein
MANDSDGCAKPGAACAQLGLSIALKQSSQVSGWCISTIAEATREEEAFLPSQ